MKKISLLILLILISPMIVIANTVAPIDVTKMSISDLSSALGAKIITSEQLVNIYLDRISAYDPNYHAINQINKNAIADAKKLDKERSKGNIKGVLHGIPILVKTNIDVEGLATTAGSKALKDNYPNKNSEVVQKLIDAGAIIIGSTNMSEFAFSAKSSYSSYGSVKNAWNVNYTPYGSSGGSSVAIALSFAAAAIGTDTNNSVRVPASANNLVGFRPTIGLISSSGVIPYDTTRDTVGTITKTVDDTAIILSSISIKNINYNKLTTLKGVNIGVPNNILKGTGLIEPLSTTYSEIYNLMLTAIDNYKKLGAKIIYLDDFYSSKYYNIYNDTQAGKTFCYGFNQYIKNTTGTIRSFEDLVNAKNKIYDLTDYLKICNSGVSNLDEIEAERDVIRTYINNYYESKDIDVLLYPTTKNKLALLSDQELRSVSKYLSSVTGYPAVNIPLGFDKDNLPYGMELFGLKNDDSLLLEITNLYDSKFNNISIPKEVPNLYSVPDKVKYIVQKYSQIVNKKNSEYKTIIKDTQSYFNNYNSDNYQKLYNEYIVLDKLIKNQGDKFIQRVIIIIVALLIILKVLDSGSRYFSKKHRYSK